MPLVPALGGQRRADLCEFEVYRVSSRIGSKTKKENKEKQ